MDAEFQKKTMEYHKLVIVGKPNISNPNALPQPGSSGSVDRTSD